MLGIMKIKWLYNIRGGLGGEVVKEGEGVRG
jgi:hypothetical protein